MQTLEANKLIEHFIHSCSHDLRAPVSSIQGLVKITEKYPLQEEVVECMKRIDACAGSMQYIIRTLSEFMIHCQRDLKKDIIQADYLVDKVISDYAREIREEKIDVVRKINQPIKWVTDEQCNYIILKNLFENAIRFSDPDKKNKKIEIIISVDREKTRLKVADNGIGIPEPETTKMFLPFHRSSEQSKGHGLGLFVAQQLINRLKATYHYWSQELVGTSFYVSIPNRVRL